jgi:hypothetical protein
MAAGVMIGIDPHKGSHTAFVIDGREKQLGQLRVRASSRQSEHLLGWASRWRQRTWAWGVLTILDRASRLRGSVHGRAAPEVQPAVQG